MRGQKGFIIAKLEVVGIFLVVEGLNLDGLVRAGLKVTVQALLVGLSEYRLGACLRLHVDRKPAKWERRGMCVMIM